MVPTDGGGNNFYRSPLPLGRYLGRDCKHWLGAGPGFGECSPVQERSRLPPRPSLAQRLGQFLSQAGNTEGRAFQNALFLVCLEQNPGMII